jgi:hypothetical protein
MRQRPWESARLAANGEPVRANFARWFGASKVLNCAGLPMVVYHGTQWDWFDAPGFNIEGSNEGGAFFSTSTSVASNFADPEEFGNDLEDDESGLAPMVIPVYLSIRNPMVLGPEDVLLHGSHSFDKMRRSLERARREGHDGALITGGVSDAYEQADQWVAFRPEQIKSALGNSGLYVPDSPSLDDRDAARALEQFLRVERSAEVRGFLKSALCPLPRAAAPALGG